ncbi:MAG TPA: UDP-N-acetylmuramate dehydrogenase [Kiritimatiellia bacterium]|nr:UDP-N-acetylmuramate dehydrogenase [Kiritimatiellia bacterium]
MLAAPTITNLPLEEEISLAPLTTLGVGGPARYLARIRDLDLLPACVQWTKARSLPIMVIGEGSNLVVADRGFPGLVIKMENQRIEEVSRTPESVTVNVGAGVPWDKWVSYTVEHGWWGIENMSLIPGTVGASPVQNIGAYGQECKQVIVSVAAFDLSTHAFVELPHEACRFHFRSSIFNTTHRDRYIITSVTFRLSTQPAPCLTRAAVRSRIQSMQKQQPSPDPSSPITQRAIRNAIISLRTNGKNLPPPGSYGNAGTFFRASQLPRSQWIRLLPRALFRLGPWTALKLFAVAVKYASSAGVKIPSRILIEACGLSSLRFGNVALYPSNPAVLTTTGPARPCATDILRMIRSVRHAIFERTAFEVPVEPCLVGFTEEELDEAFCLTSPRP